MSSTYKRVIRHKQAIIRSRGNSYQAEINYRGKRYRHTERTLSAIKTWVEQKQVELGDLGKSAFKFSDSQRADAAGAFKILKDDDVSLERVAREWKKLRSKLKGRATLNEAVDFWVRHNEDRVGSATLTELFPKYVKAKKAAMLRPHSLKEIENRVGKFVKKFGDLQPHMITDSEIKRWLEDHTTSLHGWKRHKTLLNNFFDYIRREKLIDVNPVTDVLPSVEDRTVREVERYTADEAARLLYAAEAVAPRTIPPIALGLLAGLRPSEADRLDWKFVNFKTGRIRITSETAKRKRARSVSMQPNLIAWLGPYAKADGKVCPSDAYFRKVRSQILEEAGVSSWLYDGLRHTFCTMHVDAFGSPDKTAHEAGHRDTRVMYDHYIDAVDDPDESKKYWAIYPKNNSQLIRFPSAVA